jgi:PRTRC genetic system protein F
MWALPALSPLIPVKLESGDGNESAIAKFALMLDELGMKIPRIKPAKKGVPEALSLAIGRQFKDWCRSQGIGKSSLPLHFLVEPTSPHMVRLTATVVQRIPIYLLEETLNEFNSKASSAWWKYFVWRTLEIADCNAFRLYTPWRTTGCVMYQFGDDDSCLEHFSYQVGEDLGVDADDVSSEQVKEWMAAQGIALPSVSEEILTPKWQASRRPMVDMDALAQRVARFADRCRNKAQRELLHDAVNLYKCSLKPQSDWFKLDHEDWCQRLTGSDWGEPLGALAVVLRNRASQETAMGAIEEWEQFVQNDNCTDCLAVFDIDLSNQQSLIQGIDEIKDYLRLYVLMAKLLSNFKEI